MAVEVNKLRYDRDNLQKLYEDTKAMKEYLLEAFAESEKFFDILCGGGQWKGKGKDEFQAFYHLLLQYHGFIAGESVKPVGDVDTVNIKYDPIEEALKTLTELLNNMDTFTEKSESFKRLENS